MRKKERKRESPFPVAAPRGADGAGARQSDGGGRRVESGIDARSRRELYLFPRLVARDNYSRIGIARVRFNEAGDPVGVERLGIALEPEADYELRPDGGGCEDPRITFIEPLRRYVMTYTALSSRGPRIALAVSEDLFHWERLGLVHHRLTSPVEMVPLKDLCLTLQYRTH